MRFNGKGNLFAVVADRGTIVKIYNTENGQIRKELKRGFESTTIYSVDFDNYDQWVVCISKTGTIHIWSALFTYKGRKKKQVEFWRHQQSILLVLLQ